MHCRVLWPIGKRDASGRHASVHARASEGSLTLPSHYGPKRVFSPLHRALSSPSSSSPSSPPNTPVLVNAATCTVHLARLLGRFACLFSWLVGDSAVQGAPRREEEQWVLPERAEGSGYRRCAAEASTQICAAAALLVKGLA
ncbi:hypothetical protein HPB50_015765 [Hyalomma asiaticum]|uniref:Uncharacterized protein n=1 Tax=Hyalomma asiaticum TaxID=266040 RepID=A0ACB7SZ00_HYAAI|nr:hypothetical protein HPB50_015765 [Hyalomma asiaticum]